MLKITPTTNDKMRGNGAVNLGQSPEQVTRLREPEGMATAGWTTYEEQTRNGPAGHLIATAEPLKIALIGTAPSSRMLAPFADPTWKIWACSPGNQGNLLPRIDAWFEIHGNMLWPENKHYGEPYLNWLRQQTFPIYMQSREWVPQAIPLPIDELVAEFGPYFFTSSFSWMMAMAMKAGATEVALYGIDMASRDEYILQRPGAYYFFNEGRKRGIKFSAPYESDIMQPPMLYGFSEVTPFGRKLCAREKELQDRVGPLRQQRDQLAQQIIYLEGALEDLDWTKNIFGGAQSHPWKPDQT